MLYVIEKNVPLPAKVRKQTTHPFPKMEPGDSFVDPSGKINNLRSAAARYTRKNPDFPYRLRVAVSENGELRCWCIAKSE